MTLGYINYLPEMVSESDKMKEIKAECEATVNEFNEKFKGLKEQAELIIKSKEDDKPPF